MRQSLFGAICFLAKEFTNKYNRKISAIFAQKYTEIRAIVTGTIPSSVSREDLLGNSIIVADAEFDIDEAGISSGNAAPWIYYLGAQLYNDQVVYTEHYSSLYSVISKNSYSTLWTEYPYQNTVDNTYIVVSDTTINNRVTVRGNIKLILCDGVTLTALKGICVPEGSSLDNTVSQAAAVRLLLTVTRIMQVSEEITVKKAAISGYTAAISP